MSRRVALYVRPPVEAQLVVLRAEVARRGWTVAGEHVDGDGKALRELDWEVRHGQVDVVVVPRLDAFGVPLTELVRLLDRWRGVELVALDEDTGPLLDVVRRLAEYDRAVRRERTRVGIAEARTAGKACGRPRVEFDVAPAVELRAKGFGLKRIAKVLGVSVPTLRRRLREGVRQEDRLEVAPGFA